MSTLHLLIKEKELVDLENDLPHIKRSNYQNVGEW